MSSVCLNFTYKWYQYYHSHLVYFHLAYAIEVHPCCCKWQDFIFLWLNDTPLYTHIPCFLYPLSPTTEHLHGFHVLYDKSTAIDTGLQICLQGSNSLRTYFQKWIAESHSNYLIFVSEFIYIKMMKALLLLVSKEKVINWKINMTDQKNTLKTY